ncbi:hypothetical protein HK405_006362 [Cladochytrium tenue]|nr:hypothetical protein HK405_006362 [Cladochytrium tenue]
MSPPSLTDLPLEVVQGVLVWLHPHELLRLRRACRLLHDRLAPDPWRDGDGYVEDEDEGDGDDNEYEDDDGGDCSTSHRVDNIVIETSPSSSSFEAGNIVAPSPSRPPESLLTVGFAVKHIRAFVASNREPFSDYSSLRQLRWNALGPTYLAALFCDRGFCALTLAIFAPWIDTMDNRDDDDESEEEEGPEARLPAWGGRHRQLGLRDVHEYIQSGCNRKWLLWHRVSASVRRDPTAARINQAVRLAARCVSSLPGDFFDTQLGRWLAVIDDAENFTTWLHTARPGRALVDGLHSRDLLADVVAAGAISVVRALIADCDVRPTPDALTGAMHARSVVTIKVLARAADPDELRPSLALSPFDTPLIAELDPEITVAILSVPGFRLDISRVAEINFSHRHLSKEDHTALPPHSRRRRAAMVRLAMERLVESGSICKASMPALVRAACREGHNDLVRRFLRTPEVLTRWNLPRYFWDVSYDAYKELLRHLILIEVSSSAEDRAKLWEEIEDVVIKKASDGCLPEVACLLSVEDSLIGPFCLQRAANLARKYQHIEVWEYLKNHLGAKMGMKQAATASDFVIGNQTLDLILVSDDFDAFRRCIPSPEILGEYSLIWIARRAASVGAANIVELLVDDFGVDVSDVLDDAIRSGDVSLVRNLMSKVSPGTYITVSTINDFNVDVREILEAIVGVQIEIHHRAIGNFLRSEGENEGDNVFSRENREGFLARLIDAGSLDSVPAPLWLVEACMAGSLPMVKHILASPQLQNLTESTYEGFGSFATEFRRAVSEATTLPNTDILQELCRASRMFRGCAYRLEELVSAAKMGLVSAVQVMLDAAEPSEKRLKDIAGAFLSAKDQDEPTKDGNRDGQEAVIQLLRQLAASYVKDSKRISVVPEFGESQLETSFFLAVLISDDSTTLARWLRQQTGSLPPIKVLATAADRAAKYGAVECVRTIARSPFHVRPSCFALSLAVGFLNADIVRVLAVELEVPPPARLHHHNALDIKIRNRYPTALRWADLDDVLRQPVSHAVVDTLLALVDSPTFATARPNVICWPGVARTPLLRSATTPAAALRRHARSVLDRLTQPRAPAALVPSQALHLFLTPACLLNHAPLLRRILCHSPEITTTAGGDPAANFGPPALARLARRAAAIAATEALAVLLDAMQPPKAGTPPRAVAEALAGALAAGATYPAVVHCVLDAAATAATGTSGLAAMLQAAWRRERRRYADKIPTDAAARIEAWLAARAT